LAAASTLSPNLRKKDLNFLTLLEWSDLVIIDPLAMTCSLSLQAPADSEILQVH
jgi:hypothetical protein